VFEFEPRVEQAAEKFQLSAEPSRDEVEWSLLRSTARVLCSKERLKVIGSAKTERMKEVRHSIVLKLQTADF
jgi:hypothetical protein